PSAIVTKPDFSKHCFFDQTAKKYPTLDTIFAKQNMAIQIGFFEALLLRSGCEKISCLRKGMQLEPASCTLKTSSEAKCT
ncbi:hypothetical protein, partial [Paenibacillus larvae]|uniref:hypothetical protein n=1 Tax=Paenibacillus larvae TaxID=1464 RepID=UPI002853902E